MAGSLDEWEPVLDAAAAELRRARKELEVRKRAVEAQQALLESTREWADLAEMRAAKKACEEAEREAYLAFANAAQAATAATGSKKPHKYVTVGARHEWAYDRGSAVEWCKKFVPACLQLALNEKAFEGLVEATDGLAGLDGAEELRAFAERREYLKAAIAKDLG